MSGGRVTIEGVDVTPTDIEKIPARNIRVRRAEFVALWIAAERYQEAHNDWYGAGVVMTCRWLATAPVRPRTGSWYLAYAPVTERSARAFEELIEAECLAAEKLAMRRPVHTWLANRPGWIDAVVATLNWAWRRSGRPPLTVEQTATG